MKQRDTDSAQSSQSTCTCMATSRGQTTGRAAVHSNTAVHCNTQAPREPQLSVQFSSNVHGNTRTSSSDPGISNDYFGWQCIDVEQQKKKQKKNFIRIHYKWKKWFHLYGNRIGKSPTHNTC